MRIRGSRDEHPATVEIEAGFGEGGGFDRDAAAGFYGVDAEIGDCGFGDWFGSEEVLEEVRHSD